MTKQYVLNLETLSNLNREEVEEKLKGIVNEKNRLLVFRANNPYPELVEVYFYADDDKEYACDDEPFVHMYTVHDDAEFVVLSSVNFIAKLGEIA